MSEQRQKIQLELALRGAGAGEAQIPLRQGTESLMAKGGAESPATERMMEEIYEAGKLRKDRWPRTPSSLRWACSTRRTAVYGPVRTVVWEGRSRETPPYPDPFRQPPGGMTEYAVSSKPRYATGERHLKTKSSCHATKFELSSSGRLSTPQTPLEMTPTSYPTTWSQACCSSHAGITV